MEGKGDFFAHEKSVTLDKDQKVTPLHLTVKSLQQSTVLQIKYLMVHLCQLLHLNHS